MRSVLRWLRRLVTGMVLLAAVVIAIALVAAHTGWGREQLRSRVEVALQGAFPGGAHVGAIEGSILGTLTVHDVELDGRDGKPQVTIGTLDVAVALWPLVVQTAQIDELVAEDVHVFVHDRPPPPASQPIPASAPSPWRVELPRAEIHHATVEIEAGGSNQTFADLDVTGTLTITPADGATIFGWAHGQWSRAGTTPAAMAPPAPAAELTATAMVVLDGGVHVPTALVTLGGASNVARPGDASDASVAIGATDLAIDVDHPSGTIAVSAPARMIAKLVPELDRAGIAVDRLGDVVATIEAAAATPTTTRVEINARAGQTTLWAVLHGDLATQTACGAISVHAVDLGLLTHRQVDGRGELFATGTGHRAGGAISLNRSRIVATSRAVTVLEQHVTGKLVIKATATGNLAPVVAVDVEGTAAGDGVAVKEIERTAVSGGVAGKRVAGKGVAIATVAGPFKLHVATGAPLGEAHVTATGIRNADTPIGAIHADVANHADGTLSVAAIVWPPARGLEIVADALVTPGKPGQPTVARFDRTRVTLPNGMIWAGRGGLVSVTDASVELGGVTMNHDDATVALRGNVNRPTGVLEAHVDADRFMASAIDARYRGIGSGTLDLGHRRDQWQADGTFTVSGLAVAPEAAAIDGTAHVVLAGRRATLDASATSPALGQVELAFEADAPRDLFDPGAWRALDRSAVHNATITARQVALSGVAGLAGPPSGAPLAGTVDGAVNLAPAEQRGRFAVRGVGLPFGAIDGDLTFAPHDGDLGVNATAQLPGIAAADLTARFAVPERPFDPATWQLRGRDFLKEAAADLDDVAFDPELLARLGVTALLARHGVPAPYRGHATLELALGAAATEARLAIDVTDVTGGTLVEPISAHIAIDVGAQGTNLCAELLGHDVDHDLGPVAGCDLGQAVGHDLRLGVLKGNVPMTIDRWIAEPATALRAPITAGWILPPTPAVRILAVLGRHDLDAGTLEGSATIRGTLGTPIISAARITARDVAVPQRLGGHPLPVLTDLDVAATWGGASGSVTITGHEATGGELHAFATGRPDEPAGVTGWLTAKHLDLAPITAVLPPRPLVPTAGVVEADLRLQTGRRIAGTLHIAGGALPIAASVGTLRDATADLTIDERAIGGTIDGKLGRGTVHLAADVAPDGTTIVKALQLRNVSAQSAFRPIITADITAKLGLEGGQVRGAAQVKHAHITLPEHVGTPLLAATAPSDLVFAGVPAAVAASGPRAPSHAWLVVDVALDPTELEARNVVDSVGLDVQATLNSPKLVVSVGDTAGVSGTVAIENAYVELLGRRYVLERSDVRFDGTTDPWLGIHMTHPFPVLTLNVDVGGRASRPELQFSSLPASYSQDQLFGFFVGGEPGGDPNTQTGEAVRGAVALGVTGKLGRAINKVLPINVDALSCEPATTATSASCTVGKWLSQRLFLAYRQHLEPRSDENANDVQFQYRIGPQVLIEGSGGDRGHSGADLLWQLRW